MDRIGMPCMGCDSFSSSSSCSLAFHAFQFIVIVFGYHLHRIPAQPGTPSKSTYVKSRIRESHRTEGPVCVVGLLCNMFE